ncbi:DUF975 family protein [Weissella minor]|uniref:DUF975 family protein n=1 Tax=Weissella minor TaxID=1620 RepID=UPI003AF282BB
MRSNREIKKAARQHVIGDGNTFQIALSLSLGLIFWRFIYGLINASSGKYTDLMHSATAVLNNDAGASGPFLEKVQAYAPGLMGIMLVNGVISGILALGASWAFVMWRLSKGNPTRPVRLSLRFFKPDTIKDSVILSAVRYIIITVGTMFFIVPGIVFALSFAMAPFLYAADVQTKRAPRGVTAYLRASSEMMRGYRMQLLWLNLSFIGWYILTSLTRGLLGVYVIPYYQATIGEFYLARQIDIEKNIK